MSETAKNNQTAPWLAGFMLLAISVYALGSFFGAPFLGANSTLSNTHSLTLRYWSDDRAFPPLLSARDAENYRAIFAAQADGNWPAADAAMARLNDGLLLGHVLAERYRHAEYIPQAAELKDWLRRYSDHAEAAAIGKLAQSRYKINPQALGTTSKPLQGYGDDKRYAMSFGGQAHENAWRQAMADFRNGHMAKAAQGFAGLTARDGMGDWKEASAAFWAYRSFKAAGNSAKANHYLRIAANHPRSFYGIMALKALGRPLQLESAPGLSDEDKELLLADVGNRRVLALWELKKYELADQQLRHLFPRASRAQKERLLGFAHELNLASAQISMAKQLAQEDKPLDYARYPIPAWKPQNGFLVDPALVYALMRQESGFKASATSGSGASGLMQLMPQTASMMQRALTQQEPQLTPGEESIHDPAFNIALGQNYVQHLLRNPLVEGNLIYMMTAYNAGPGRLAEWKTSLDHRGDPLLFIESIPFAETRAYVMQVMANYWVYSAIRGEENPSLFSLARGEWPRYAQQARPSNV